MTDTPTKILDSIKAPLGLAPEYTPFDVELLLHINSAIDKLRQLNVGYGINLWVNSESVWGDLFVDDSNKEIRGAVESYIFLTVKMLFDMSSMSAHHIAANKEILKELEWRINVGANPPLENMPPTASDQVAYGDEEIGD